MVKTIISVFLFAFVANIAAQTVAVNTTELCTSYRYLVSWDLGPLSSANYTVDSTSISSAIADYLMTSSTGSRYNYLLPQSGFNYTVTMVDAQDRKKDATSFASEPCQNLPTYGKTLGEQATLVLDYHRKQVLGSYRIYRNPKLERLSELFLTTGRQEDIPYFLQQLNAPDWYSYEIAITDTNADAGSLIQILLDQTSSYLSGEKIPFPNSNIMREVGFAYNSTQEKWCIIMTNRTSIKCGNGLLDAAEECDDGNRDDNDGCSSNCQVEDGWSCPDNVLLSGSVCVTTPSYNPPVNSPDQGSNPNSPAGGSNPSDNSPSGSNSPSGGNNPTTGSPSGSNSPSTQQTSGSSKIQFVAATVAFLIALLW